MVLVLDASYRPLSVISTRRAIRLLAVGKAESVSITDEEWRAANIVIKTPIIIKLLKSINIKMRKLPFSRKLAYSVHNCRCAYCNKTYERAELSIDHVMPSSRGGENSWKNIVLACIPCNTKKGNKTPEEAGMRLHYKPTVPHSMGFYNRAHGSIPEEWKAYIY